MAPKIKPSTKEYKRDRNGRMTTQWTIKHYTVASTSTKELIDSIEKLPRKKNAILKELAKRGVNI
jgi:phosphoribosylaminoimidazole-succinocarboxamide synthase